jgi:hypothetical protein
VVEVSLVVTFLRDIGGLKGLGEGLFNLGVQIFQTVYLLWISVACVSKVVLTFGKEDHTWLAVFGALFFIHAVRLWLKD